MPDSNDQSASESLEGLSNASTTAPPAEQTCQQKHWIGLRLRYKDDKTDVGAAECVHLSGGSVNDGPLGAGKLVTQYLDPGKYEAELPEIDADEWEYE
jgi:hypothetical protein